MPRNPHPRHPRDLSDPIYMGWLNDFEAIANAERDCEQIDRTTDADLDQLLREADQREHTIGAPR